MKGKKDNKIIISYNLPQNSLGDKSFDDIAEILRRRFIDVVLPSDDTIDRPVNNDSLPPQKRLTRTIVPISIDFANYGEKSFR